jgi:beta-galactosidase
MNKSKKITSTILICLSLVTSAIAQNITPETISNSLGSGEMPIGVYYYPEHWPENQWERDLSLMAELGFQFTHFAEFAWASLEPEEGSFTFEWLDKVVDIAHEKGLKVIMCTPTPTPPAWLTQKHPEILSVNADFIRQEHGSRLQAIYDHPSYLHYASIIIGKMAERYGNHPAVAGWQLDNEPHFGPIVDYSKYAAEQFPVWLRQNYNNIDSLNQAWGTAFWSQSYNHFDQIVLPNPNRAAQGVNPHHMLDYQRFMMDRLAYALRFQADLIRETVSERQWVTTNYAYFKFLPLTDPFRNRHDLDFASHTMYLTSGYLRDEGGPLAHRLGSGLELSFSAELARSVNETTGIMELQPGQINWGLINPQPLPGAVRMWIWHTWALGDRFVCAYRFRQPLFGSEQTHKGIIDTDGTTVARGGKEYLQAMQEIAELEANDRGSRHRQRQSPPKAALSFTFDNINDIENHRHHVDFDPWQHVYDYYAAVKSTGSEVKFVQPNEIVDPTEYPFWIVPSLQQIDEQQIKIWKEYANKGGHLIISSRTGKKDLNGHLWEAHNQEPVYELIGAKIPEFDHLPAKYPGTITFNGKDYQWYRWGDWLEPFSDTQTLATYSDQFYSGTAAVTQQQLGKGNVTYIGVWSNGGELEKDLLNRLYEEKDLKTFQLPDYIFTGERNGYRVFINYSSEAWELPLTREHTLILGNTVLEPGGVTVIR